MEHEDAKRVPRQAAQLSQAELCVEPTESVLLSPGTRSWESGALR